MDKFNGTRVMKFHSSAQWSPQFERIDGGSYGKSLYSSQWNDGGSFGRALSLPQMSDRGSYGRALSLPQISDRGSYGRALSSQWKAPSEGVSYGKATRLIELTSSNQWKAHLDSSKQSKKLMVIYFTATWCGPCKALEPFINDMAAKFTDVDFIKIDVDKLVSVSAQYGVQTMPTFILMKNGKEVDKVTGVKKEELQMKVMRHRTQVYYG